MEAENSFQASNYDKTDSFGAFAILEQNRKGLNAEDQGFQEVDQGHKLDGSKN